MIAFLLHHRDDLSWVRRTHGPDVDVIAHEDYLPLLLDEPAPAFFAYPHHSPEADEAINFLTYNWYRDESGADVCARNGVSIAEAFSVGLGISIAGICREYFALKYWCERYERVCVSCNEYPSFVAAARKFGDRVAVYDPEHRGTSPLRSQADRVLGHVPAADWRFRALRLAQWPIRPLLRGKTLVLENWTLSKYAAQHPEWISEKTLVLWKGVYFRRPPRRYFVETERSVPLHFDAEFAPVRLKSLLELIGVRWDDELVALISETMTDRYRIYRDYFVKAVAFNLELLDAYGPSELVLPSEYYESHVIAAQLAKVRGIKVSWLVDGYPIVDAMKGTADPSVGPAMFDRVYAVSLQHELRLRRQERVSQEIITIFPPILDCHNIRARNDKRFDAIIMTWIPNDLRVEGRNGARPNILMDALRIVSEAGLSRLAIKIKGRTEREWLVPLLNQAGYGGNVEILEGPFSEVVSQAHRVIGGISSAVGETAFHDIPYYVYEPPENGYTLEQIESAVVFAPGGVARSPEELRSLLKRRGGSVISDRTLLFGTERGRADWSWDQTREAYTDWAADWADRSGIKDALQWRGVPLWWASNLIAKDTGVDYAWYQELHNRLRGLAPKPVRLRSDAKVHLSILKSFAKEFGKWMLLRLLPAAPPPTGAPIWFHSLESNLLNNGDGYCDRMYEQAYLDDATNGFVSAFVIRLAFKRSDFLHPLAWRRRVIELQGRLKRHVEILDRYYTLRDIIGIHLSLARGYRTLKRLIAPLSQVGIRVGHAEFGDILRSELQRSFGSNLPWSLGYAAMFERWLGKARGAHVIVTYGETLAPIRPAYARSKALSPDHRWISIQHATIYKNKLGFYHRYSEFNRLTADDRRQISPAPDHYFVHGPQAENIVGEFFPPGRIHAIGCLKYDRIFRKYGARSALRREVSAEKVLLLAPSVGDEQIILSMFAGLDALPGWRVVLSKHPAVKQERITEMIQRNRIAIPIEFGGPKSTIELIEGASLVVCSYSSIAFEARFLGVASVRVVNLEQPPMVEDEPGIPYLATQAEFLKELDVFGSNEGDAESAEEIQQTIDRYFLRFDGNASARFWVGIREILDAA